MCQHSWVWWRLFSWSWKWVSEAECYQRSERLRHWKAKSWTWILNHKIYRHNLVEYDHKHLQGRGAMTAISWNSDIFWFWNRVLGISKVRGGWMVWKQNKEHERHLPISSPLKEKKTFTTWEAAGKAVFSREVHVPLDQEREGEFGKKRIWKVQDLGRWGKKQDCDRSWRISMQRYIKWAKGIKRSILMISWWGKAIREAMLENGEGGANVKSWDIFLVRPNGAVMVREEHPWYHQMGLRGFLVISAESSNRCGVQEKRLRNFMRTPHELAKLLFL